MKKLLTMTLLMAATLLTLTSCKEKKSENPEGHPYFQPNPPQPTDPKDTDISTVSQEIVWVEGRHYFVTIIGKADSTLSMVENEYGQKFIDNSIRLDITRADSTTFFSRTFTKDSFVDWLDKEHRNREKAILTNMSFLDVNGDLLSFIVSLNDPEAGEDESADLLLQIDRHGGTSIKPFTYDDRDDLNVIEQQ